MNIYEDQNVEITFDELTALVEQLLMNLMAASLRNLINSHQAYQDIAASRPQSKQAEPF